MSIFVAGEPSSVQASPVSGRSRVKRGSIATGFIELWEGRDILLNLVRRDLKVRHRGSFFGMLWSLATPLLIVGLYTFIFTIILPTSPAKDSGNIPFAVYFFVGLATWNLFATSLLGAAGSILGGGYLLKKVYFRREILPLSAVLSALVTFGFEICVALVSVLVFVGLPSWEVIYIPLIVAVILILSYGIGLILAAATVFFRDIEHFLGIFIQLWFWGTPIIYTLSLVSKRPNFVTLLKLNPMSGSVISMRNVMLLHAGPDWKLLAYDLVFGIVFVAIGQKFFRHTQRLFAEMV